MLATLVRDVYRHDECRKLRDAIDGIASPLTCGGFASTGVYLFFDPVAHGILYVGLARDLATRFAQHNGLLSMRASSCKRKQIIDWFGSHESLGYAVFLQSSLDQIAVSRQRSMRTVAHWDEEDDRFWDYGVEGLENIQITEGVLLASYRQRHGKLPVGNRTGGDRQGNSFATPGGYRVLELAAGKIDSLLLARKTIRDLADDPEATAHEEALHSARVESIEVTGGRGIDSGIILRSLIALANNPMYAQSGLIDAVGRMKESGYWRLPPPYPATPDCVGAIRPRDLEG